MDLTKRQKEIFDFISRYVGKYGYPPTVREIGKAVGLHSSSTVHAHLAKLEKSACCGATRRSRARSSCWSTRRSGRSAPPGLPLVGHVAAGEPILAEENIEDYLEVPDVIGGEDGDYVLKVRGDSMNDAGILEGDFVVVRPADERRQRRDRRRADRGRGDGEALLPRGRTTIRLQPENEAMEPIRSRDGEAARQGRRSLQERLSVSALATAIRQGGRASARRRSVRRRGCSSRRGRRSRTSSSAPGRTCGRRPRPSAPSAAARCSVHGCASCGSELSASGSAEPVAHLSGLERHPTIGCGPCSRGGRRIPRGKSGHHRARAVGNAHPGKPAGKCHRNTRPMARPHVSRAQAKVKWCGKSAPASR